MWQCIPDCTFRLSLILRFRLRQRFIEHTAILGKCNCFVQLNILYYQYLMLISCFVSAENELWRYYSINVNEHAEYTLQNQCRIKWPPANDNMGVSEYLSATSNYDLSSGHREHTLNHRNSERSLMVLTKFGSRYSRIHMALKRINT